nr:MAG TPA: hypothetical protein [Caudoviricetes sp.]
MKNFLIHQFTYRTTKHTHVGQPHELIEGVHPATQEGVFNGT